MFVVLVGVVVVFVDSVDFGASPVQTGTPSTVPATLPDAWQGSYVGAGPLSLASPAVVLPSAGVQWSPVLGPVYRHTTGEPTADDALHASTVSGVMVQYPSQSVDGVGVAVPVATPAVAPRNVPR